MKCTRVNQTVGIKKQKGSKSLLWISRFLSSCEVRVSMLSEKIQVQLKTTRNTMDLPAITMLTVKRNFLQTRWSR